MVLRDASASLASTSLSGRSFHCLPHIFRIFCFSAGGRKFIISKLCFLVFLLNGSDSVTSYKKSFHQNLKGSAKRFCPKKIPHLYVIGQICSFCPTPSLPCFLQQQKKNTQNTRKTEHLYLKWCGATTRSDSIILSFHY